MKNKYFTVIFLLLLAVTVFVLKRCKQNATVAGQHPPIESPGQHNTTRPNRERGFDRTTSYLEYTNHAICRMGCRQISKEDIKEIMMLGKINYAKSAIAGKPCPTYALQGYTSNKEHLQVIFAQCNEKTKVITCYNLDEDFECHCPGDEKK